MMRLRQVAAGIALGALAAAALAAGAEAARKTWAEECNEHDKREARERCCTLKTIDCYNVCRQQFEEYSGAENQCFAACKRTGEKCDREIKSLTPPHSTTTRPGSTKTMNTRLCCRTRTSVGWASSSECRRRRGRAVSAAQCRRPDRKTRSESARVCCELRRGYALILAGQCRARQGRQVNTRRCRTTRRLEGRDRSR